MNLTTQYVGVIMANDLRCLAPYRARMEWMLCVDNAERYWLKVPTHDEELFRKLPLLGRWTSDADGKLTREGSRVPEAILPSRDWRTVADLLPVGSPQRAALGMPPPAIRISLELGNTGDLPDALICQKGDFSKWSATAFAQRVECLRFACCDDGRVFVMGSPLPPLPGAAFYRMGRIWVPCGWMLPNFVWPELLEEVLGLGRNRMCLLHPDGSCEEFDEENLIPANRAAARSIV